MKKIIFLLLIVNVCEAQYFNVAADLFPISSSTYLKGKVKTANRIFYNLTSFDTANENKLKVYTIDNNQYYFFGKNQDTFDIKGNLLQLKEFDSDGKILRTTKYNYNDSFRILSINVYTDTHHFPIFEAVYENLVKEKKINYYDWDNGKASNELNFYYNQNGAFNYLERNDFTNGNFTKEYYSVKKSAQKKEVRSITNKLLQRYTWITDDTSVYTLYKSFSAKAYDDIKFCEERRTKFDIPFYRNYVKQGNNKKCVDIVTTSTQYNNNHHLTQITIFDKISKQYSTQKFEYKYDAVGNIIEKIYINNKGEKYRISRFEYQYYD